MADRYPFVTGRLAAPALRATLERAELPFDYDVAVMRITVAALMTTTWIARRLEVPPDVTRIMIPGLCQGDLEQLSEQFDVPADKGPADLKRLPAFFGQTDARSRYGGRDIRVFAEINNVPHLDRDRILEAAGYYRDAGADGVFVPGLLDLATLRDLTSRVDMPVNVMVGHGAPSMDELAAAGVRRLSQGGEPFLAAVGGIKTLTERYLAGQIGAPADVLTEGASLVKVLIG